MSYSFFQQHFSDVNLIDCSQLLRVEGAGGNRLPYHGYVDVNLTFPLNDTQSISRDIPVLIVQDTKYNATVPLLIGTNFLGKIPGDSNISLASCSSAVKMAVAVLQVRAELLDRSDGVLGEVFAATDMVVSPHTGILTYGNTTVTIPIRQQLAIIEPVDASCPVFTGLVEASVGSFTVPVEIKNRSDFPIQVRKGDKIAHLLQAEIQVPDKTMTTDDKFLDAFQTSHLSDDDAMELKSFLSKHSDLFALSTTEMGCTDVTTHRIELDDPTPFKDKVRPIPPGAYDELKTHLAELLSAGVITESKSPFSSNMVIIRKRCGALRLCIDFRRINAKTIKDAYTIPRVDTLLDSLKGARYFASIDLISGYHQVKMHPEHCERTAFSAGPFGFFEFKKMPFGLCNSPSTFQRLMEKVLEGLNLVTCAVYLDDVIIFARSKTELYERLTQVFDRLREANLKMKPKKCEFLKESINFLGYIVSEAGIRCSETHLQAVSSWPPPSNIKELQTFLGFMNFYRRFIAGFATIAHPLLLLLRGRGSGARSGKKRTDNPPDWFWGIDQQLSFETLKSKLMSPPILAYPEYDKPFILHVDASLLGLGAVLYQDSEEGLRAIAYASKSLNNAERNYSVHKLEYLAFKWAVTEKFHHYLYGQTFNAFTDHNPLAYVTTTAKLDATGHRSLADLSKYNFHIFYKPGSQNADADGMSRRPHPDVEQEQCTRHISPEVFKEICILVSNDKDFAGLGESLGLSSTVYTNSITVLPDTTVDWALEQRKDPDLLRVIQLIECGVQPTERQRRKEPSGVMRLLSHWSSLSIKGKVLYKSSSVCDIPAMRVVIPVSHRQQVLTMVHDDHGHLGKDKTLSLAQERFFWVGLLKDIECKLKSCFPCICAKSPHLPERAPLVNISTSRPLELVCIDFMSLEMSKGGFQHILVVTDHFTKYALAFPTRNKEARTVAKILVDQFIVHYGIPERLHSDQGANFQGKIIKHLCDLLGVKKSRTTPYHPQGDGVTERFNRTLLSMLKTLDNSHKANWKDHIAPLVYAYNCTRHETTHYTPFFLMFGRTPRLLVDVFLGVSSEYSSSVSEVKERLESAYRAASDASKQAGRHQAKGYNRKVRGAGLCKEDFVLVKNVGLKGKHKLANRWKTDRFVVIEHSNPDIPVFKVKGENSNDVKTLHRNMLLPLVLPFQDPVPVTGVSVSAPVIKPCSNLDSSEEDHTGSSDSEDFNVHIAADDISIPVVDEVVSQDDLEAAPVASPPWTPAPVDAPSPFQTTPAPPLLGSVEVTYTPPALPLPSSVELTYTPPALPLPSSVELTYTSPEQSNVVPVSPVTVADNVPQSSAGEDMAEEQFVRRSDRTKKRPARYDD